MGMQHTLKNRAVCTGFLFEKLKEGDHLKEPWDLRGDNIKVNFNPYPVNVENMVSC